MSKSLVAVMKQKLWSMSNENDWKLIDAINTQNPTQNSKWPYGILIL
jgi:hypothetical protein